MKVSNGFLIRFALLLGIWIVWLWVLFASFSALLNMSVIVGGVLLNYPLVLLGRKFLDRHPSMEYAVWTTTIVDFGMGLTFGIPIVRAVSTYEEWAGRVLPVPREIGLFLVMISGLVFLATVINLALKGSGAPFFIVLSRKMAAGWMYARCRNPMALAALALFLSLGIWFQAALFLIWVLVVLAPAYVFFAKVYEERELEIRFGNAYLDYKSRTPMFIPLKVRKGLGSADGSIINPIPFLAETRTKDLQSPGYSDPKTGSAYCRKFLLQGVAPALHRHHAD
jgi:hypothetical protein